MPSINTLRIGIDLGGSKIAAGIVRATDGKILHKISTQTIKDSTAEQIILSMAQLCKDLVRISGNVCQGDIASVGIGLPGSVNPKTGTLLKAPNLGIENVDISHQMSMLLNKDVYVENDANCAALAEHRFGVAVGTKNSVTITLGTGIGGGIIIDNKIFAGSLFGGGEIGHHVIKARGEKCSCKRHGCWESYASATALRRMAGGKSPKEVFAKARAGDKALKAVVDEYIEYLCEGLVNIANILQPEIIVIGGGISGEGSYFLDKIHNSINGRFFDNQNPTKIVIAGLGNDAGIIGAALLERRR